jgi:hypothetical protein
MAVPGGDGHMVEHRGKMQFGEKRRNGGPLTMSPTVRGWLIFYYSL